MLFTVGRRYDPQASDTVKSWLQIPLLHFLTWEEYRQHAPRSWLPIGVEIGREAVDLPRFQHPREAVYILGAEDHGLTNEVASFCKELVVIPARYCLNVAVAGAIVMYDRSTKKGVRRYGKTETRR